MGVGGAALRWGGAGGGDGMMGVGVGGDGIEVGWRVGMG